METKITLLVALMIILWASPVWAEVYTLDYSELDELPEIEYEIGQVKNEPTQSKKKWTAAEIALLALMVVDWGQTREIASNYTVHYEVQFWNEDTNQWEYYKSYKYEELNPLLGKHPEMDEVNKYFIVCIGLHALVAQYAPSKFSKYWTTAGLILESYCVGRNISYGIDIRF